MGRSIGNKEMKEKLGANFRKPMITDTGVISQNPLPSVQSLQAQFPGLCKINEQEVICIYRCGTAPTSLDGSYALVRSTDGGKTWHNEGVLWDRKNDNRIYSYGYGYPVLLENGEILLAGYRWDRSKSDSDYNIYNPKTSGAVPLEALLFRSGDNGITWSSPQVIPPPHGIAMANPSSHILPLKDGCLFMPLETWKTWDDTGPIKQRSIALFSSDNGKTWKESVTVAMDPNYRILYWNGMFTRMEDGRIFVMYWTKESVTEKDMTINATYSEDEGKTWLPVYDTGIIGQMGCTIDAGNGNVLTIYNRRDTEKAGIWMVISQDGGRTWPKDGHTLLWDARSRDIIGSMDQNNRSRSIYDEGLMAFGKPDIIRMDDNRFLVGFWCTSNFVIHLRYAEIVIS